MNVQQATNSALMPPHYFLLAIVWAALFHWTVPGPLLIAPPASFAGVIFVVAGIWIASASSQLFARRGTAIRPFETSSVLVTDGWFRYSRNPMYVAMLAILAGVAMLLGTLTPWLSPALLAVVLKKRFVEREEAMLTEQFGDEYLSYKQQVRRWL